MPQYDRAPAFQFYPKDFLSDPNVLAMDNRQVGVYIKLLSICWMQDGLPDDLKALARMVGETVKWMTSAGSIVLACFKLTQGGRSGTRLHHPRLVVERKRQTVARKKRSDGGKLGNAKRWANQRDTSPSDRVAIANDRSPTPTPTPTPTESQKPTVSSSPPQTPPRGSIAARPPDRRFAQFWMIYPKHRDRAEAEREWANLTDAECDDVIAHLPIRIANDVGWREQGGRFIPKPAVFIRDRRWLDDWRPSEFGDKTLKNIEAAKRFVNGGTHA